MQLAMRHSGGSGNFARLGSRSARQARWLCSRCRRAGRRIVAPCRVVTRCTRARRRGARSRGLPCTTALTTDRGQAAKRRTSESFLRGFQAATRRPASRREESCLPGTFLSGKTVEKERAECSGEKEHKRIRYILIFYSTLHYLCNACRHWFPQEMQLIAL